MMYKRAEGAEKNQIAINHMIYLLDSVWQSGNRHSLTNTGPTGIKNSASEPTGKAAKNF